MKKTILYLFLILAVRLPGLADDNAVQFWQIFDFDWHADQRLTLGLSKQLRYQDTFTVVESDISEVSASYKLENWLSVHGQYRFIAKGDETRNRFIAGLNLKFDLGAISISNRARIQNEHCTFNDSPSETSWVFRDRIQVTFCRQRPLRPFVGAEIFLGMNDDSKSEDKFRLSGGLDFHASKAIELSLFYHFEHDLGEKTNETTHVLAGKIGFSF